MLFLCSDNHVCVLCKESTDVVQIIALFLLYLFEACQQLVNFEELWAAGVGRSCAKPAERECGLSSHTVARGGRGAPVPSLTHLLHSLGSSGRISFIAGSWMKELLKKYQISPDLSQWLLK